MNRKESLNTDLATRGRNMIGKNEKKGWSRSESKSKGNKCFNITKKDIM